eukprot:gnl/MRDRNA2_/MRDRNA2_115466_c0_seq1.p1 gnl/MRDRNA2_/MRDRNA2_115466_c0~~gnl/MRDRNA2_/MRDRNA2_115466_c0_seq1.p1  ORF type:complete len:356 (-),score=63.77 gnl/MRDRNA2_/MRDRNA2_115466_c0_seq1:162-1229(-)
MGRRDKGERKEKSRSSSSSTVTVDGHTRFRDQALSVIDGPVACDGPAAARNELDTVSHDVELHFKVGNKVFGALRQVVILRNEFFRNMLVGGFREARENGVVTMEYSTFDPKAFREFLIFLHVGKCEVTSHNVCDLYEVADYFNEVEIKSACMLFLARESLTAKILCSRINLAEKYSLEALHNQCTEYILAHAEDVLSNPERVSMLPASYMHKLLSSDKTCSEEGNLFEALVHWHQTHPDYSIDDLLQFIRLPLIPTSEIMTKVQESGLFSTQTLLDAVAFQADRRSVSLPAGMTKRRGRHDRAEDAPEARRATWNCVQGGSWSLDNVQYKKDDRPLMHSWSDISDDEDPQDWRE